ncbi:MAG: hypothetical protein LBG96_15815 [Tannerella sp.]|nr:hypothetical protein [Tannerella sp.]
MEYGTDVAPVGVLVWLLLFTLLASFIVFGMNEKLKLLNKERLSPFISPKTITGFAAQQPLKFDSLCLAAYNAVFVAKKNSHAYKKP